MYCTIHWAELEQAVPSRPKQIHARYHKQASPWQGVPHRLRVMDRGLPRGLALQWVHMRWRGPYGTHIRGGQRALKSTDDVVSDSGRVPF